MSGPLLYAIYLVTVKVYGDFYRYYNLTGFPDIYMFTGECEMLIDQQRAFVNTAKQYKVNITYVEEPNMIHAYPLFASLGVRQAREFFLQVGDIPRRWLRNHRDVIHESTVYNDIGVSGIRSKLHRKYQSLTDLVGLDVRRDILLNLQQSFNDDRYAPHPLLEEMVEKGQLGKKSGQGFFDWD